MLSIQTLFCIEKVSSKETMFLPKSVQKLHMSFPAMTHLAEGLCLNALLTLMMVERRLQICLN
jgi:hypothetical protein